MRRTSTHVLLLGLLAAPVVSFAQKSVSDTLFDRKGKLLAYTDGYRVFDASNAPLSDVIPTREGGAWGRLAEVPDAKGHFYVLQFDSKGKSLGSQRIAVPAKGKTGAPVRLVRGFVPPDSNFSFGLTEASGKPALELVQHGKRYTQQIALPTWIEPQQLLTRIRQRAGMLKETATAPYAEVKGKLAAAQGEVAGVKSKVKSTVTRAKNAKHEAKARAKEELAKQADALKEQATGKVKALLALAPRPGQLPGWAKLGPIQAAPQAASAQLQRTRSARPAQAAASQSQPTLPGTASASNSTVQVQSAPTAQASSPPADNPCAASGANTATIWAFGEGGGLQFTPEGVRSFSGPLLHQLEGSATISDSSGRLLAYSDGSRVWDATNSLLAEDLGGHASATQAALFVPGSGKDEYFLFTLDQGGYAGPSRGLSFTKLRLTPKGGSVLAERRVLQTQVVEKLAAVPHANGRDHWVLTHGAYNNRFYAFPVAADVGAPVTSDMGAVHSGFGNGSIGQMKLSPDGKRVAVAITGSATIELLTFNDTTGKVSAPVKLAAPGAHPVPEVYGLEFSPSGQSLYATSWHGGSLWHFAVDRPSDAPTLLSDTSAQGLTLGSLQLGPDGTIYAAVMDGPAGVGTPWIGTIRNPDATPTLRRKSIQLAEGTRSRFGLPSFSAGAFSRRKLDFHVPNRCAGQAIRFDNWSRGLGPDSLIRWHWDFGDGSASTGKHPVHRYDSAGTYLITLRATGCFGTDSLRRTITVTTPPAVELGPAVQLPQGSEALTIGVASQPHTRYRWSTGSNASQIEVQAAGQYVLTGAAAGCACSDTLQVLPRIEAKATNADNVIMQPCVQVRPYLGFMPQRSAVVSRSQYQITSSNPAGDIPQFTLLPNGQYLIGWLSSPYQLTPLVGFILLVK